jgi:2-methylcitrate dehydratase PrpD
MTENQDHASISQTLAAFVDRTTSADLPDHVVDDARWRLMDTIGVALAGTRLDYAQPVFDVMAEPGGRAEATTIAFGRRLPTAAAAFVNAAFAHGPDFDDTHSVAMVHIGCLAVPSALAVAERTGASGSAMMTALVLGAETGLRIGAATPHRFHERGYHATGVVGPFTAAAAAGKLLGLSASQVANALGLAGSQSAGLLEGLHDGSWVKRLHPAWSVQSGITAALMAQRNFIGPKAVLEGTWGLYAVLLHGDEEPPDLAGIVDDLGTRWLLPDTTYKPYSCGAWNHSSMDAVITIMRSQSLRHTDIARIDVTVPTECLPIVCEPRAVKIHPGSPYHMKFSLPYSVAILAVRGHAGVDDYSDEVFADADIADLAARVYCVADPQMPSERFPARVVVETRSGARHEFDVPAQRGGPGNPSTPSDHRAKFQANAEPTLGADGTQELADVIENVWDEPDVDRLAELLKRKDAQ